MKPTFILLAISLLLAACGTAAPEPTAVPPTSTPLPSATPTVIPTPTLPFMDMELQGIFTDADLNPNNLDINNAHWDPTVGLTIYSSDGTEIVISEDDLMNRVRVGQDGNLQILTEDGTAVMYAVDPATNEVLFAGDWMRWPIVSVEACVNVDSYEAMEKVWEKEYLFTLPFDPNRTYFPNKDSVYKNWSEYPPKSVDAAYPFGLLPDGMESPMRFINCVVVDTGVGYPMMVISQQVFNPVDGTSSIIRFVRRCGGDISKDIHLTINQHQTLPWFYFLPTDNLSEFDDSPAIGEYKRYLSTTGKLEVRNGKIMGLEEWIEKWLTDGKVPDEMKDKIFIAKHYPWYPW